MYGKPVRCRRCPRNGKQAGIALEATVALRRGKAAVPNLASPETGPDAILINLRLAGTLAA
jgi:hypothetical protein